MTSYASHGIPANELAKDRTHVESDLGFIPEDEMYALLTEAGFVNALRFYQAYLFGGWVATKRM